MTSHCLILGAGLVGASLAYRLGRDGHRVTVLEAGLPATAASGRSFGWINASYFVNEAHFRLRHAGIAAHHRLAAELAGTGHAWSGCLWWEAPAGLTAAADRLAGLGYRVEMLMRRDIARRLPELPAPPDAALWLAEEGAVDAAHLTDLLLKASGAALIAGLPASRLTLRGGRIVGVDTPQGRIAADLVVLATGTGAPALLAPLGFPLPMQSRPGGLLRTRPLPRVLPAILASPEQEARQEPSGSILAPATARHQADDSPGLDRSPIRMAETTLARLRDLLPGHDLQMQAMLMADRPVPGDGLPALGPVPGLDGAWLAVLHSGVTLAPLVAELMTQAIATGAVPPALAPWLPARFL